MRNAARHSNNFPFFLQDITFVYPVQPAVNASGIPCGWSKIRMFIVSTKFRI